MAATLAFVDVESTGLDPDRHEVWEIGLILRAANGFEMEYCWQLPVDLGRAESIALSIGRYHERRVPRDKLRTPAVLAAEFARLTHGAHLVGAVPSFDAAFLSRLLRANGACPGWHYHLVDVEALAAGFVAGSRAALGTAGHHTGEAWWAGSPTWAAAEGCDHNPPWRSSDLSLAVGVDPTDFDRHTALGDARWAKAIYDAVTRSADERTTDAP